MDEQVRKLNKIIEKLQQQVQQLNDDHFKEIYRLYFKTTKLIENHHKQINDLTTTYQSNMKKKKDKIESLQQDLKIFKKAANNTVKLQEKNQELTQALHIYAQLQDIFIENKEIRPTTLYSKASQAIQKGYLDKTRKFDLSDKGWCLIIPETILTDENIKSLQKFFKQNSFKGLQFLSFPVKTSLQIKQKSYIDDKLWKVIAHEGKKFADLKILDLSNFTVYLNIEKGDLEQFESLKEIDFSTIQMDKNNRRFRDKYRESIKLLKEFSDHHPHIKIQATQQNGQWMQWYNLNTYYLPDNAN